MEAGIYPSKSVRLDWTVNQMDYFYKNYHKYHLDPSYKDDDVESEYDGIAISLKPEFELDAATNMENGVAHASNVSNDCVADIEVEDISMSGLNFTWNKCPGKVGGLLKKLDRIMGHNVVMGRINRGRVSVVEDMNGVPHFGVSIGEQFVNHFQSVLGKFYKVLPINNPEFLFTNKLSEGDAAYMIRDISDDEVKVALFDIDNNKAPGPDGYSSKFFKDAWNVIAKEFCKAVREFFTSGKLLKE
nr:hypothetical protein [Tanacetum cinerariifolium]